MHDDCFRGRHILVTGAGTGIGLAIARRMALEGARVSLVARDLARVEHAAAELRGQGCVAGAWPGDVRDAASIARAVDLACNAPGAEDRFDDLVATNLAGTYHTFRAAERRLAPGPEARHLLAVASILARIGVAGYTGYCASKSGILGLVRALAAELAPRNVQVNALCPGWVDTAMAREGLEGMARGMGVPFDEAHRIAMSAVPLARMSTPDDVAGTVRWALSPDARGLTGQAVDLNNGAFMI